MAFFNWFVSWYRWLSPPGDDPIDVEQVDSESDFDSGADAASAAPLDFRAPAPEAFQWFFVGAAPTIFEEGHPLQVERRWAQWGGRRGRENKPPAPGDPAGVGR